jgi:KDO2-lipid IV(A) lauroyltransferase
MQLLLYLLVYPILLLISILPFRILYLFSDFVYLVVYYVFRYRKKIVRDNLALALPHLSDAQRLSIERKSYRYLCDMFLEMIKTITISKAEMDRRFVFTDMEEYKKIEKEGKSISLLCAHYASYEWAVSMNSKISIKGYGIYKKINNKYFDKLVKDIRSKFKAELIPINKTADTIAYNHANGIQSLYGFASDQSPQIRNLNYWQKFMGVDVPVYVGAEILAKKFDMNVVFLKVSRVKRGYYQADLEVLTTNVKDIPDFQIMDTFLQKVEALIINAPEFYLWTHKRWKHKDRNPN